MKKINLSDIKINHFIIAFLALGALCVLLSISRPAQSEVEGVESARSVDTYVPHGFTLVPVEVTNSEALDALIGDVGGVVDLYLPISEHRAKSLKVASKIKLVRAPLRPQQFAAMIRNEESGELVSHAGPFLAVVQNPESQARGLTPAALPQRKIKIQYQN